MFDLLFARTFTIVGAMLVITAIAARVNKTFETAREMWLTLIGTFAVLFAIIFFADSFPLNLVLVGIFSGLMGWEIGPTIEHYGRKFKLRRYLKDKGIVIAKDSEITPEQKAEFQQAFDINQYQQEWQNIVFQALSSTALAVFGMAGLAFLTGIDFGFLGGFLLISLIILILMSLINAFFFRSPIFSLLKSYFGAVIFTLYLLYDFDRLEKLAGNQSWGTAVDLAVSIYLDIINLFLYLLQILGGSSD